MRRFNPFLQAVITYFKQHGPPRNECDVSTRFCRLWSLTSNNTAHHETNATFQPVSAGCDHLLQTTRPTMKRMRRFNPFLQAVITYFIQHGPPWNECYVSTRFCRLWSLTSNNTAHHETNATFQPVPTGCDHLLHTTRPTMKRMRRFNPFLQAVITYFIQHGPPWNECDVSTRSYRLWSLTSNNTAHHETNATFQPVPTGCDHLLQTTRPTMKLMRRFNPFLQAVITYFIQHGPPWNEWTFQPVPTGCDHLLHTTRPTMKRMRRFNPFLQAVITYFIQHGPPWN